MARAAQSESSRRSASADPSPYTPELQPAEHLREIVDEPIVNEHIPDLQALETLLAERCIRLADDRQIREARTGFHWRPKIAVAN